MSLRPAFLCLLGLAPMLTECSPAARGESKTRSSSSSSEPGRVLPPPVPQRPQVVVPCENVDETYFVTCDKFDASPSWPRAPSPHERCAASLRRGVFMSEPPTGAALFNADVTHVTCADLGCGYSYCTAAKIAMASAALPRPKCGKNWENPQCFPAPPAGTSQPANEPYSDCPAAVVLMDGPQALDVEATAKMRRTPASAHNCCYMQCLHIPG